MTSQVRGTQVRIPDPSNFLELNIDRIHLTCFSVVAQSVECQSKGWRSHADVGFNPVTNAINVLQACIYKSVIRYIFEINDSPTCCQIQYVGACFHF